MTETGSRLSQVDCLNYPGSALARELLTSSGLGDWAGENDFIRNLGPIRLKNGPVIIVFCKSQIVTQQYRGYLDDGTIVTREEKQLINPQYLGVGPGGKTVVLTEEEIDLAERLTQLAY